MDIDDEHGPAGARVGDQPTVAADRTEMARSLAGRFAKILTEAMAPSVLVTALLLLIVWHEPAAVGRHLLWATLAILFATVLPMAFVFLGVRHRRWSDHHVPEREKRMLPLAIGATSVAVGYSLLRGTAAPRGIITLYSAIIIELVLIAIVTRYWKISGHVAAAASCATVLTWVYGPTLAASWLIVPLLAWARIQMRAHTLAQTVAGAVLAAATVATVYAMLQ